jgi:hypothetical protein
MNNNNTTRVNLNNVNNNNRAPNVNNNPENADGNEQATAENEPLIETTETEAEPAVSMITIMKTFVLSFLASFIPENPAI